MGPRRWVYFQGIHFSCPLPGSLILSSMLRLNILIAKLNGEVGSSSWAKGQAIENEGGETCSQSPSPSTPDAHNWAHHTPGFPGKVPRHPQMDRWTEKGSWSRRKARTLLPALPLRDCQSSRKKKKKKKDVLYSWLCFIIIHEIVKNTDSWVLPQNKWCRPSGYGT